MHPGGAAGLCSPQRAWAGVGPRHPVPSPAPHRTGAEHGRRAAELARRGGQDGQGDVRAGAAAPDRHCRWRRGAALLLLPVAHAVALAHYFIDLQTTIGPCTHATHDRLDRRQQSVLPVASGRLGAVPVLLGRPAGSAARPSTWRAAARRRACRACHPCQRRRQRPRRPRPQPRARAAAPRPPAGGCCGGTGWA